MSEPDLAADGGAVAIRSTGLSKRFGKQIAVNGIDLRVPRGAVYGFIGPNGSGKTTTIRMLLGLISPDGGEVEVLGGAMPGHLAEVLPKVGALVEGPAFYPHLSGSANLTRLLAVDASVGSDKGGRRVAEALERVGLTAAAAKKYRNYSLGMKQRLGLAAALIRPRDLLILDEPMNGLDPQGTREVRSLIKDVNAEGTTVLVSSHLLSEVEHACTHIGVMSAGRLVRQASMTDLVAESAPEVQLTTTSESVSQAVEVLRGLGLSTPVVDGGTVTVPLGETAPQDMVRALVAGGVDVVGFEVRRRSLEDLFVDLTGAGFDVAR